MSQGINELHALHTFRGFNGCTIGISAQRSVSHACFKKAAHETFGKDLTSKVFFLFSDAPGRVSKAARSVFKSLVALGEDSMHLVFRLESCWGGKRLEPSQRVLQLHKKFSFACSPATYFYTHRSTLLSSVEWPSNPILDTRTPEQWSEFCTLPFDGEYGYESYVAELATISATFVEWKDKRNSKGVSALRILRNAATRTHYEYLQNSSRLIAFLGDKAFRLGVGTTTNEQLHHELKIWMRNIRMSHFTRFYICTRIFVFMKLLVHSSACYSPTLIQTSQSRLIHTIASEIRHKGLFPEPRRSAHKGNTNLCGNIHKAPIKLVQHVAIKRSLKRKSQKILWAKENTIARVPQQHSTNIFKRPRAGKPHKRRS